MAETFFKIRKKGSDPPLYSTGGQSPKWKKKGKKWNSIHHVKLHLGHVVNAVQHHGRYGRMQFVNGTYCNYDEAEVVIFEATPVETKDIQVLLDEIEAKQAAKRKAAQATRIKRAQDQEKAELRRLQAKYPNT